MIIFGVTQILSNFLCQSGKVRCLGVSNFNQRHLEALLVDPSLTHPPRVNQVYKWVGNGSAPV